MSRISVAPLASGALVASLSFQPFALTSIGTLAGALQRHRQLLQAGSPRYKVTKTAELLGQQAAKIFQLEQKEGQEAADKQAKQVTTKMTWKTLKAKDAPKVISECGNFFGYKPTHPSLRWVKRVNRSHLRFTRVKALSIRKIKRGGRNNHGKISVRHRGGGSKRFLRTIDFYRRDPGPLVVKRLEHDPNRAAWLALMVNPATGGLSYVVAFDGMKPGDVIRSWRKAVDDAPSDLPLSRDSEFVFNPEELNDAATFSPGNALPLKFMPPNTKIFNIALHPLGKGILCRAAGTFGTVVRQDPANATTIVKLQSTEVRTIHHDCIATVGQACNVLHKEERYGNAGARRRLGWRPRVSGKAMNRCDHPHGGGRGHRKTIARGVPMNPWGGRHFEKTRKKPEPHVVKPRLRGDQKQTKSFGNKKRQTMSLYTAEGRMTEEEIHAAKAKMMGKKKK